MLQCLGGPMDGRMVLVGEVPRAVVRFGPGSDEYELVHMIGRDERQECVAVFEAYAWAGLTERGARQLMMQPLMRWLEER